MITGSYIFATIGCLAGAELFLEEWYVGIVIFNCFVVIAVIAAFVMRDPPKREEVSIDELEQK